MTSIPRKGSEFILMLRQLTFILILFLWLLGGCNMTKKNAPPEVFFNDPLAIEMGHAIHNADTEKIKTLAQKIDINAHGEGKDGMTLLIWTMKYGTFSAYETLLELGADPGTFSKAGHTALGMAGLLDVKWAKALIGAGADINQKDGGIPLWWGGTAQDAVFEYFLSLPKLNINAQDSNGYSILMKMPGRGRYDRALKLLDKGADMHLKTDLGSSFAYRLQNHVPEKDAKQYPYYQEVLKRMEAEGITLPVKGPRELKEEREGKTK